MNCLLAVMLAWIGTWGAAPQQPIPGTLRTFRNQTVRLIVHTSAGGARVRIRISNIFGDHPLVIGAAHIARSTTAADIDYLLDTLPPLIERLRSVSPAYREAELKVLS